MSANRTFQPMARPSVLPVGPRRALLTAVVLGQIPPEALRLYGLDADTSVLRQVLAEASHVAIGDA